MRSDPAVAAGETMAQAEQAFRMVAELTRLEAVRYLPALSRVLAEFGRCCRQVQQFERAAAMFGSATEAVKIQLASKRVEGPEAEVLACELELIELMSSQALALAQSDHLPLAYEIAGEFVVLARARLPHTLPLLTGGLAFMADLADDLGRPRDGIEHLIEGLRVLAVGSAEGLPGAEAAAARLGGRLRSAADALEFELSADVAALLTKLAPT